MGTQMGRMGFIVCEEVALRVHKCVAGTVMGTQMCKGGVIGETNVQGGTDGDADI